MTIAKASGDGDLAKVSGDDADGNFSQRSRGSGRRGRSPFDPNPGLGQLLGIRSGAIARKLRWNLTRFVKVLLKF
ncbi:hypothetical protein HCG48_13205 [Oxynema aestuarii AP17]|uniref:Uncharacterized protein n=2 Tax=Oxynema TaxID=1492710 RepID=A0A6H1U1C7_9CYAN|nr:hypothetical protein HCG48_13205 [Oxynema aestuarii AP17]